MEVEQRLSARYPEGAIASAGKMPAAPGQAGSLRSQGRLLSGQAGSLRSQGCAPRAALPGLRSPDHREADYWESQISNSSMKMALSLPQ